MELPGRTAWYLSVYAHVNGHEGSKGGVLVLSHDITERKTTEETLRKSEERYSKLLATIPDLVIMTDMRGNIILVNEPTLTLSGCTSDEVIGHSLFSFMVPEDMAKAIKNAQKRLEGKLGLVEYHLIMKDGSIIIFEANGKVLRDSDGSRPVTSSSVGM